jgi:hypothetical protein
MFATAKYSKGDLLAVFGGHVIRGDQEPTFPNGRSDLAIQISDDFVLGALCPEEISAVDAINHSCSPNAGLRGQILLVAMRDIEIDEQVCFDYAMCLNTPGYRFDCACGTLVCRGVVTGEDWKIPELQTRYYGYFSTYLQDKINAVGRKNATPLC